MQDWYELPPDWPDDRPRLALKAFLANYKNDLAFIAALEDFHQTCDTEESYPSACQALAYEWGLRAPWGPHLVRKTLEQPLNEQEVRMLWGADFTTVAEFYDDRKELEDERLLRKGQHWWPLTGEGRAEYLGRVKEMASRIAGLVYGKSPMPREVRRDGRALYLRIQGHRWRKVAEACGYPSWQAAKKAVTRMADLLQLELPRGRPGRPKN